MLQPRKVTRRPDKQAGLGLDAVPFLRCADIGSHYFLQNRPNPFVLCSLSEQSRWILPPIYPAP